MQTDESAAWLPHAGGLAANLDMTLGDWLQRYQDEIVFRQVRYRGVPAWKNVLDLWIYQEIIWETAVEAVVEIGTRFGGTTLWLSDTLRAVGSGAGLVVSVDVRSPSLEFPDNVRFIEGDSLDAATIDRVRLLCAGRRTMVIADSNHSAAHVLQEMTAYSPLITPGCYFIAEDAIVDVMGWKMFTPGPQVAAIQFVAESEDFVIDHVREKFLITNCPGGFLKRVAP
jgi:cephalosporin hydroxylase